MIKQIVKKKQKYTIKELQLIFEPFRPQSELDYHDYGILTNEDIMRIYNEYISDCIKANYKKVRIITGKGKVVRPKVNKLLSRDKRVEKSEYSGYFSGGSGSFDVILN